MPLEKSLLLNVRTGLQIIRHVSFEDEDIVLEEHLCNRSASLVYKGVWNVTQIRRPCFIYIPAATNQIRSYHHEDTTLPPVSDQLKSTPQGLEIACVNDQLFKYGGFPGKGELTTVVGEGPEKVTWTRFFDFHPNAKYLHNSIVEVYNSHKFPYCEVEVHSPAGSLKPGDCLSLHQRWHFR